MHKKIGKLEKKIMKLEIKWILRNSKQKERAKYNMYLAQIKSLKGEE